MSDRWIELSHPIVDGATPAKMPFLPDPSFRKIDDADLRATEVTITTHVGTHLEAPRHLFKDGTAIDAYPADRWIGRGVVAEVEADAHQEFGVDALRLPREPRTGEALLVSTGWEHHVGEKRYFEPPYFSEALAEWIVDREVSWVGVDSPSPERPGSVREADPFEYPVHRTLLGNDVPIAEHLTNTTELAGEIIDTIALPIRYVGSDGAHARIVAIRRSD